MRFFQIAVAVIFLICCCVCSAFFLNNRLNRDLTIPKITFDSDEIHVSVSATDDDLLKGVEATDTKDGNISSKLIIESISNFIEPAKAEIIYAVCDNDKHVAHNKRTVIYDDYSSPVFGLNSPLIFSVDRSITLTDAFCATDVIDGDISDNIILTVPDYEQGSEGIFTVHAMVSNSKGDTVNADFPLVVEEMDNDAPAIELTQYYLRVKSGDKVDPKKYIASAYDSAGNDLTASVTYKYKKEAVTQGLYKVDYYVRSVNGSQGHTILLIAPEN